MEASMTRPDVAKVPYDKVSAGQVQDDLRHRMECSERELGELEDRRREVGAVHEACVAALESFHHEDGGLNEQPIESREAAHRRMLEGQAETAAAAADEARRQVRDWDAVRAAADAGLKALSSNSDGGTPG